MQHKPKGNQGSQRVLPQRKQIAAHTAQNVDFEIYFNTIIGLERLTNDNITYVALTPPSLEKSIRADYFRPDLLGAVLLLRYVLLVGFPGIRSPRHRRPCYASRCTMKNRSAYSRHLPTLKSGRRSFHESTYEKGIRDTRN